MFENALDWLCFNLPGHELPIKFSSGIDTSNLDGKLLYIMPFKILTRMNYIG